MSSINFEDSSRPKISAELEKPSKEVGEKKVNNEKYAKTTLSLPVTEKGNELEPKRF